MKTRIPIKKYVDDPKLSWEERYRRLEAHHKEETEFLIKTIGEFEERNEKLSKENSELLSYMPED